MCYENYNFASVVYINNIYSLQNVKRHSEIQAFNETLGNLMDNLACKCPIKVDRFTIKSSMVNSFVTIYGLGMCLRSFQGPDYGVFERSDYRYEWFLFSQVGDQVYLGNFTEISLC